MEARRFLDGVFSAFALFLIILSACAAFFAPALTHALFSGFSPEDEASVTLLMRIMLLQPFFLGISNLFASVTQLERRFFVYAVSPILYNAGIIAGIVFFYPMLGLSGLAWGVVFGAFLHLLVQIPVVFGSGLMPHFTLQFNLSELKEVALVSLPRTLALSAQNISVLVLTSLGSVLGVGAIAVFNFSWNLQSIPLSIVGASYSLAAFPTLSRLWTSGARDTFEETLSTALRHILFWSFPALALFIVLRAQIVRTVLGAGNFDWSDTRLTAAALALFAISVVAQSIILLFTRAYYAAGKTKTPLAVSMGAALGTVLLALLFSKLFEGVSLFRFFLESLLRVSDLAGTAVLVLPLSYSLGTIGAAFVFLLLFRRELFSFHASISHTFWQSLASSVIIGFSAYFLLNFFDTVFDLTTAYGIFLQGLAAGVGGLVAGAIVLYYLGNLEIREIWRTLHHKIWKAKFIGPDPTETTF